MKYYRYKMNLITLNIFSLILLIIFIPIMFNFSDIIINFKFNHLILMIIWLIIHEIMHYIGFRKIKNINKKNIVFGAKLEKGILYCMCKQKINKQQILVSLVFPLISIGIITLIIGIIIKNSLLILLSITNIAGSSGDIAMFIDILKMPENVQYIDLDDPTSFNILTKKNLTKNKYFGLTLIENGIYNENKMKAIDYCKLKITTCSKIILATIILIEFLNLFNN